MTYFNKNTQMGSALTAAFNRRENCLNGGNAAEKQEPKTTAIGNLKDFDLPECFENLSLQEIFEKGKPSDEELEAMKDKHANDNFSDLPTDPEEMVKILASVEVSLKTELLILKTNPLSDEEYAKRYNQIQVKRAHQLLAEFMIGQDLKSIATQYGIKKNSKRRKEDGRVTKADVIKQRYPRLGARQIRDFQKLELKYIWEAIIFAFSTGQELTRALALSNHIKKQADNKPKALPSKMKRWRAKDDDFETEFKILKLMEEMGATSLFANIGCGTSLLEKYLKICVTVANELEKRRAKAHQRLYPSCEVIQGSITDEDVFNRIFHFDNTDAPYNLIWRYVIDTNHFDRTVENIYMCGFDGSRPVCIYNVPLAKDTRILVDVNEPVKEALDIEAPRIGLKLRVKKASNE